MDPALRKAAIATTVINLTSLSEFRYLLPL